MHPAKKTGRPDEAIRLPDDFAIVRFLDFARQRAVKDLEIVGSDHVERIHRIDGRATRVRFELATTVRTAASPAIAPELLTKLVVDLLDLRTDLGAFRAVAEIDPILGPLVRARPGLRIPRAFDPFETMVRAIVGQVVSVAAATTFLSRLVARWGEPVESGWRAFPTPEVLAAASIADLKTVGLTTAKATTIGTLAAATASGDLDWQALARMDPAESDPIIRRLPGVGAWTSSYVHLRALGDTDAFLATDLGVVKALAALGVGKNRIEAVAERWRPWRSYAVIHLWASLGS